MSILINIASEFTGKKAFKQAESASDKLDRKVKALGKSLALTFGAAALANYSKNAVKAFAADEAAAVRLTQAVDNLGLGFANARVAAFIADLEKTAAVADDQLRPAFQALLTTTGSLTKSQELLNLAIETSRGSGIDLATTSQDIANAYVGVTRGLRKYNLGLSQAELKTLSFAQVQEKLNDQFTGSNAAYLDTAAGKLAAISLAADNAAETIGGSLVNAIGALSGSSGAAGFAKIIDGIADKISYLIDETSEFIFITKYLFNPKNLFKSGSEFDKALKDFQQRLANSKLPGFDLGNNAVTGYGKDNAAQKAAEAAAAKRARELAAVQKKTVASQKALSAEQKKQNALKKAGTVFDLDQIQLIAALKGQLSDEEKTRVLAQLALLAGNYDEAKRLTDQIIAAQDGGKELAEFLAKLPDARNPFAYLDKYLANLKAQADAIAGGGGGGSNMPETNVPNTNPFPDPSASQPEIDRERGNFYGSGNVGGTVVVQIDGRTIGNALLDQSMSAGQVAYLDRRTGGFG
jgi:hypothetical protein